MAYHVIEGNVVGKKEKIGIVCARFNEFIVSKLLGGAIDGLVRHGISEENIDVAWVPGAFEIPLICEKMVKTGKYDAVIALGVAGLLLYGDDLAVFIELYNSKPLRIVYIVAEYSGSLIL